MIAVTTNAAPNPAAPQSIWKNKTFSRMFSAFTLASFGDWFDVIALMALFSYVWQADPYVIALIPIMFAVPSIVFGQFAGVWVDRVNKVRLMLATDFIRAALTVGLIFAPNYYWALGIMFLRASAAIFNQPAQQALLRNVVEEKQLLQASSMFGMVFQLAKVIGPLIGSSIIAFFSPQACLIVNVVCFTLSGVILLTVGKVKESQPAELAEGEEKKTFGQQWAEGWNAVISKRTLWASVLFFILAFSTLQIVDAQIGVLMRELLPDNPEVLGYIISSVGVGALAMTIVISNIKGITSYGTFMGLGSVLIGAAFAVMSVFNVTAIWAMVGLGFMAGIGTGMVFTVYSYIIQIETPPHLMGRVTSINSSLSSVMIIVAPLSGSALITSVGALPAFEYVGIALCGVGLFGFLFQRLIWGKVVAPAAATEEPTQAEAAVAEAEAAPTNAK